MRGATSAATRGVLPDIVVVGGSTNVRSALLAEAGRGGADTEKFRLGFDLRSSRGAVSEKNGIKEYNETVGSSEGICAFSLLKEPSMAAGEITDEAYVNQPAVLRHRSELVERLYWSEPHRDVIRV